MKTYLPHKSSLGNISANIIAMVLYLAFIPFGYIAFVFALVVYFVEQNSGLIKFHAVQASSLWGIYFIAKSVISIFNRGAVFRLFSHHNIFNYGYPSGSFIWIIMRFVLFALLVAGCIIGAIKAYGWHEFVFPGIGDLAMQIYSKGNAAKYNGDGPVPEDCKIGAASSPNQGQASPPPFNGGTNGQGNYGPQFNSGAGPNSANRNYANPAPPPFQQAQPPYGHPSQPQQASAETPAAYTQPTSDVNGAHHTDKEQTQADTQTQNVEENNKDIKQESVEPPAPVYTNYNPVQNSQNTEDKNVN